MKKNIKKLALSLILPQFAGFVGALFTTSKIPSWYATLNKPFFNPPSWVFGPVWTTLYFLMGYALYLVWNSKKSKNRDIAIKYFFLQLTLNSVWSIIFFGLENPTFAFLEILVLLTSIIITTVKFKKISLTASYLMYPYIAWVSFATFLNVAIAYLN